MAIFTIWYAPSPRKSAMDQNTCVTSRKHVNTAVALSCHPHLRDCKCRGLAAGCLVPISGTAAHYKGFRADCLLPVAAELLLTCVESTLYS